MKDFNTCYCDKDIRIVVTSLSLFKSPLIRYILKRVLLSIPLIFGIIVVNFSIVHLAPGDPVQMYIGEVTPSPEYVQMIRERFGLDKPLYVQLFAYIESILSGDLGYSFAFAMPVVTLIFEKVSATILLIVTAIIFACLMGVTMGAVSAIRKHSLSDNVIMFLALAAYSIPQFWLGMLLILLFSFVFPIFPTGGITSLTGVTGINYAIDVLYHLFLPALTLSVWYLAIITRLTRSNMIDVLSQNFITLARSIGLGEKTIIFKHVLRNALLPLVTIIGANLGFMLAGATLVETVFSWPGLGRLMWESLSRRDYPVIMGLLLFSSIMVITCNIITDIVYAFIDPRIRYK